MIKSKKQMVLTVFLEKISINNEGNATRSAVIKEIRNGKSWLQSNSESVGSLILLKKSSKLLLDFFFAIERAIDLLFLL